MTRLSLCAFALVAACAIDGPELVEGETEGFRATSVCIDTITGECRFDAQGHGCLPRELDACSVASRPAACIDVAELCFAIDVGDDCEVGFVDACTYAP
jgi:hypothetical protein